MVSMLRASFSRLFSQSRVRDFTTSTLIKGFTQEPSRKPPNLKGVYFSQKIDVISLHQKKKIGRLLEDEFLVVSLPSLLPAQELMSDSARIIAEGPVVPPRQRKLAQMSLDLKEEEQDKGRHCVYFAHGAVVFFNCDEETQRECLEESRPFAKSILEEVESEDYEVEVDPTISQEVWSAFLPNKLVVHTLDLQSVSVIATIIGQAVALRHFEYQIDTLLEEFDKVEKGPLRALRESKKAVVDVILKLGLLDQASEDSPAWQENKYHSVWKGLRDEFEIDKRWRVLSTKTDVLQDTLKFQVELKHAEKSTRLEVIIILLIFAELLISSLNFIGWTLH